MSTTAIAPVVRQKIEIPYSYVAGPAVGRFLLGLKDKKFFASVCTACGNHNVPPLSFCGRCWRPVAEFTEVGPGGTLESFAAVPHATVELPGVDGQVHYGLIRLDGATTLLAHLVRAEGPLRSGMRVTPEWHEQRNGSILDLACYRPRD
jgi:uncharacterized OB-fold protein